MDTTELRATMLQAILAQGIPLEQAVQDTEAAVAYVVNGAEPPKPARALTRLQQRREDILDMWSAGFSGRAIATRLSVPLFKVSTCIYKYRQKGDPRAVRRVQMSDALAASRAANAVKARAARSRS